MKTNIKTDKSFDSVKMMRDIRDRIDKELKGMTSEEVLKYYEERRKKIKEWKRAQKPRRIIKVVDKKKGRTKQKNT